jgi:hypothetical protein
LVGDADAIAFESYHLFGMVGQDANVFQTQIDQNLGADAAFMLHHALASWLAIELTALVETDLGKGTRCFAGFDSEASAGMVKVEENAPIFFGDGGQGPGN